MMLTILSQPFLLVLMQIQKTMTAKTTAQHRPKWQHEHRCLSVNRDACRVAIHTMWVWCVHGCAPSSFLQHLDEKACDLVWLALFSKQEHVLLHCEDINKKGRLSPHPHPPLLLKTLLVLGLHTRSFNAILQKAQLLSHRTFTMELPDSRPINTVTVTPQRTSKMWQASRKRVCLSVVLSYMRLVLTTPQSLSHCRKLQDTHLLLCFGPNHHWTCCIVWQMSPQRGAHPRGPWRRWRWRHALQLWQHHHMEHCGSTGHTGFAPHHPRTCSGQWICHLWGYISALRSQTWLIVGVVP